MQPGSGSTASSSIIFLMITLVAVAVLIFFCVMNNSIYSFIGNVLNGTIGKQMVDTLVESTANVEVTNHVVFVAIRSNGHQLNQEIRGIFLALSINL